MDELRADVVLQALVVYQNHCWDKHKACLDAGKKPDARLWRGRMMTAESLEVELEERLFE
ncbi:MAG: hypothetical protein ACYS8I_16605 [Planctomycetota bacterium]